MPGYLEEAIARFDATLDPQISSAALNDHLRHTCARLAHAAERFGDGSGRDDEMLLELDRLLDLIDEAYQALRARESAREPDPV